jgi:hypothetical protein
MGKSGVGARPILAFFATERRVKLNGLHNTGNAKVTAFVK